MNATIVATPDDIPEHLPVTKRLHERIVTEDGLNPSTRTNRAILAAIGELEAAIAKGATDA